MEAGLASAADRSVPAVASPPRLEIFTEPARPLLRPAPRSTMFFPLVVVAAVLPGLYALNWWDLTPPGPWWGLRGLAVREGHLLDQMPVSAHWPAGEAWGYRLVALQPPLYAWLEGIGFWVSPERNPLVSVLPSYAAGVLVVVLVYWHGKLWWGPGLGLTAAILTALNRNLLLQMQQASPVTLGLAGTLAALLAYGIHLRSGSGRGWLWVLASGAAMGLSLMTVGLFALACIPVVLLHQAVLGAEASVGGWQPSRWWRSVRSQASVPGGIAAVAIAMVIALPWHAAMMSRYGNDFIWALVSPLQGIIAPASSNLLLVVLGLVPTTLPLALFAAGRTIRQVLTAEGDDPAMVGGALWLAWLAVAALFPAVWTTGPRSGFELFLLVPLNLLAARAMVELASRRVPARTLVWLAPATALTVAWWLSSSMREAVRDLSLSRWPEASTWLGLHLGLDLILLLGLATRRLDRWARRRDRRRRLVLGGFLVAVLAITAAAGLREVRFRHLETAELLDLRAVILRRNRVEPLQILAVVSQDPATFRGSGLIGTPGGRLRFILRSALPHLAQFDLSRTQDLVTLPDQPRMVVLVGPDQQMPYAVQSQLKLEMLHPGRSGMLTAFASVYVPPPRRSRR